MRLDALVTERGLADSRSRAQALIRAGRVAVEGRVVSRAAATVPVGARIDVGEPFRYVSRGGDKLAEALRALAIDVTDELCLDVGSSTGGFVDCLLQSGAAAVVALDVGHGELHPRLCADPRVTAIEGVNARHLQPGALPFAPRVCTIDVSFIPLGLVLAGVARALARPARVIALVKPQFEAGRGAAPRGVVRDPEVRAAVVAAAAGSARLLGLTTIDACDSGHPGPAGNRETFLHLVTGDHPDRSREPDDLEALLARAVA